MALVATSCTTTKFEPPPLGTFPPQIGYDQPAATASTAPAPNCTGANACPHCQAPKFEISPQHPSLELPPGRWALAIDIPPQRLITLGIAGPRQGLINFQVIARGPLLRLRSGSFDDDKLLPTFLGFESPVPARPIAAVIETRSRVRVFMFDYNSTPYSKPPRQLLERQLAKDAIPLIALPAPSQVNAGYRLQSAPRYVFVRADVAAALRSTFRQTRKRFKRNPIYVGDASQWNGQRPASDLGKPRHISHAQGRDVDLGLPVKGGSRSLLKRRCQGTLVDNDRLVCAPGTSRQLDAPRLAYLLATLIEGPTRMYTQDPTRRPGPFAAIETIFLDQVYIDQIRRVLPELRRRRWIHNESFQALGSDGLLRHSPWHVDHVHVRFAATTKKLALHPLLGTNISLKTPQDTQTSESKGPGRTTKRSLTQTGTQKPPAGAKNPSNNKP